MARGIGRLYVYDQEWGRILVFLKSDGSYISQWSTRGSQPSMQDMRGMYVTQQGSAQNPKAAQVTWATPRGIFKSTLTPVAAAARQAAPAGSPGAGG